MADELSKEQFEACKQAIDGGIVDGITVKEWGQIHLCIHRRGELLERAKEAMSFAMKDHNPKFPSCPSCNDKFLGVLAEIESELGGK